MWHPAKRWCEVKEEVTYPLFPNRSFLPSEMFKSPFSEIKGMFEENRSSRTKNYHVGSQRFCSSSFPALSLLLSLLQFYSQSRLSRLKEGKNRRPFFRLRDPANWGARFREENFAQKKEKILFQIQFWILELGNPMNIRFSPTFFRILFPHIGTSHSLPLTQLIQKHFLPFVLAPVSQPFLVRFSKPKNIRTILEKESGRGWKIPLISDMWCPRAPYFFTSPFWISQFKLI